MTSASSGRRRSNKALDARHPATASSPERIRHLAKDPLTVVVMGEFSAGKSSFLNRLLGTEALPVAILPKTATLTRLVYGDRTRRGGSRSTGRSGMAAQPRSSPIRPSPICNGPPSCTTSRWPKTSRPFARCGCS